LFVFVSVALQVAALVQVGLESDLHVLGIPVVLHLAVRVHRVLKRHLQALIPLPSTLYLCMPLFTLHSLIRVCTHAAVLIHTLHNLFMNSSSPIPIGTALKFGSFHLTKIDLISGALLFLIPQITTPNEMLHPKFDNIFMM
jgi:hypothetical protein